MVWITGDSLSEIGEYPLDDSKPLAHDSAIILVISLIDLIASSFPGITISIPSGSELVSTKAITGIPIFFASRTAIFSYLTSITKIASGRPFISLIPPTLASSFVYSFCISTASFLISFSILPEEIISSISWSLLIEPLIVFQLVKVPPNHLLLT